MFVFLIINRTYFNPRSPSGLRLTGTIQAGDHNSDFNPRSPSGLRRQAANTSRSLRLFQSTQPEWAATGQIIICRITGMVFQSTQPEWAATVRQRPGSDDASLISIHAARVGCDCVQNAQTPLPTIISIHAARVGCDCVQNAQTPLPTIISIHAARVGCDCSGSGRGFRLRKFQSTQPEWAATECRRLQSKYRKDFNPRSPSGLRLMYR